MRRDKTERLLNLVFALMGTQGPISRAEIRSTVAGYESSESDDAFERMFERDKDELRSMGIPIETVFDAFGDALGYLIAHSDYAYLDLDLTARDLTILSIATQVWDEAVLGNAARTALRKIESQTHTSISPSPYVQGVARVRAQDGAIIPLLSAARERKVVSFLYRATGHKEEKRTIEPWSVICRNGNWYVVGYDQCREEERTFKLSRIRGTVTVTAKTCTQSVPADRSRKVELPQDDKTVLAHICVTSGQGGNLIRNAIEVTTRDAKDFITIEASTQELLMWMLASAPALKSVEPEELRDELLSALSSIAGTQPQQETSHV